MPWVSLRFDPAIGPLLNVAVAPSGTMAALAAFATSQAATGTPAVAVSPPGASPAAQVTNPIQNFVSFASLIDSGASHTCISPSVAQTLKLQARGKKPMSSASHSIVPANVYLVDILLPCAKAVHPIPDMQVIEWAPAPGSPYQILFGRDILCRGVFTMTPDGHFSFSL